MGDHPQVELTIVSLQSNVSLKDIDHHIFFHLIEDEEY
jgi:hypothetical protein